MEDKELGSETINEQNAIETKEDINLQQFMAKYDRESDFRIFAGPVRWIVGLIAISFSLFQLYTAIFGSLDAHLQRAVHHSFAMALVFL